MGLKKGMTMIVMIVTRILDVISVEEDLPVALAHLGPDVGAKSSQGNRDADHSAQNHKSELSHPQVFPMSSHLKSWALNEICWNSSTQISCLRLKRICQKLSVYLR